MTAEVYVLLFYYTSNTISVNISAEKSEDVTCSVTYFHPEDE